jgi:hypothetical protein
MCGDGHPKTLKSPVRNARGLISMALLMEGAVSPAPARRDEAEMWTALLIISILLIVGPLIYLSAKKKEIEEREVTQEEIDNIPKVYVNREAWERGEYDGNKPTDL